RNYSCWAIINVKELDKEDSWFIEFDDTIETERTASGSKKYICRPFSRFTCSICHHRWASSKSMVVGVVKVRRYKQNCERCEGATFEEPNCYGQESEPKQHFYERILKGGHVSKHCEAAGQVCVTCAKDIYSISELRPFSSFVICGYMLTTTIKKNSRLASVLTDKISFAFSSPEARLADRFVGPRRGSQKRQVAQWLGCVALQGEAPCYESYCRTLEDSVYLEFTQ
uniref:3CxxC-type domain-containing protein n=1 Tax=Scleropages formosus TaxID=113540 RepID=A0A8C9SWZ1_SCLFO